MPDDHLIQIIVHNENENGVEVRYNSNFWSQGTLDPQKFRLVAVRSLLKEAAPQVKIAGSLLFDALFHQEVLALLIDCLEKVVWEETKIFLELTVEDKELLDLPWAELYFPQQNRNIRSDIFLKYHNEIDFTPPRLTSTDSAPKAIEADVPDDKGRIPSLRLFAPPPSFNPTPKSAPGKGDYNNAPSPAELEQEQKDGFRKAVLWSEEMQSLRTNPIRDRFFRGSYNAQLDLRSAREEDQSPSAGQNICYLCFAEQDRDLLAELEKHLMVLVNEKYIEIKKRDTIQAGRIIKDEVAKFLATAKVTILFVSADFLLSADCLAITSLLKPEAKNTPVVFWVAAGASNVDLTVIGKYQCANDPDKPLKYLSKKSRELAMVKISRELMKVIKPEVENSKT